MYTQRSSLHTYRSHGVPVQCTPKVQCRGTVVDFILQHIKTVQCTTPPPLLPKTYAPKSWSKSWNNFDFFGFRLISRYIVFRQFQFMTDHLVYSLSLRLGFLTLCDIFDYLHFKVCDVFMRTNASHFLFN